MHAELALWKSFPCTCLLTSTVEHERKGCTVTRARELHVIQALCAVAIICHGVSGTSKAENYSGVRPFHKLFSLFLPRKLRLGAQMSSGPFEALSLSLARSSLHEDSLFSPGSCVVSDW